MNTINLANIIGGCTMFRTRLSHIVILLAVVMPAQLARSQGRGEGAVVNHDGVTIYQSSKGSKAEVLAVSRGFAVAGVTTLGLSKTYQFEEENGRVHVLYLNVNEKGEQKSLQRTAWIDVADLDQFTYECGCESGAERKHKCSPLAASGFVDRSWNTCFREGYSKKMAELKTRWGTPSSSTRGSSAVPDSSKASAASRSENPITNDDVIALAKAGLGDDLVVAKLQQAPREALDVSADTLIRLNKEGLHKPILDAMVRRASQGSVASPGSSPPADERQTLWSGVVVKPAVPANQASLLESVVAFRTGEEIPLGLVQGLVTVDSIEVTGWPTPNGLRKAEGRPEDATNLTVKLTDANRGKKNWNCQYRVAILDEGGKEIGLGEREVSLGGHEKKDTNRVSVKIRTLDFPLAAKLSVRAVPRTD